MDKIETYNEIKKQIKDYKLIDSDFQKELLELIDNFEITVKPKRYSIQQMQINKELDSAYMGCVLSKPDSTKGNVMIIHGEPWTGKTTTFDKIMHFFCKFERNNSLMRNKPTKLKINVSELDSENQFEIEYDSLRREKLSILRTKSTIGAEEIETDVFLKDHYSLLHPFNNILFLQNTFQYSFISSYLSDQNNLRELYRNPALHQIISLFERKLKNMKLFYQNEQNRKTGLVDKKIKCEKKINSIDIDLKLFRFRIDNEIELLELKRKYQDAFKEIEEKNKDIKNKKNSISKQIKDLNSQKIQLEKDLIEKVKDKYDVYINRRDFICYCGNDLPTSEIKTRLKDHRCCYCGLMPLSKNIEKSIDETEVIGLGKIKSQIKDIEKKLESLQQEYDDLIKSKIDASDILKSENKKLVNEVKGYQSIEELKNEIENAKVQFSKESVIKEETSKIIEEIQQNIEKVDENLRKQDSDFKNIYGLFEIIKKNEDFLFVNFSNTLLKKINDLAPIIAHDLAFGTLEYRDSKLYLIGNLRNDKEEKLDEMAYEISNTNQTLSQTQLHILTISSLFSFLSMEEAQEMIGINCIFIDIKGLEEELLTTIFETAKKLSFFVYIFMESIPPTFSKYDNKKMDRNTRRVASKKTILTIQEWLDKKYSE